MLEDGQQARRALLRAGLGQPIVLGPEIIILDVQDGLAGCGLTHGLEGP
jgi:hypothetical protein